MDRFRFVDSSDTLRLDLLSTSGWYLAQGLDFGQRSAEKTYIFQAGVDGATLATTRLEIRQMRIPLLMRVQANVGDMLTLLQNLTTELDRETNIIEFRPTGHGTSFYIDTYRADVDGIIRAQEYPDIFRKLRAGVPLVVDLDRAPKSRGGGTYF